MVEMFLYKFNWDCGRMGDLDGLFVATEDEVKRMMGEEAYFGEVLGKHSEVYGTIDEGDIVKLDVSPSSVLDVSKYLGYTWSGFNPMRYTKYTCDVCEASLNSDEGTVEYRNEFEKEMCEECYTDCKSGGKMK